MAFGMNFFRKYQGRLLLILASLLMVTWAVGGALVRFFTPPQIAGTMFGEEVLLSDFSNARRTLLTLSLDRDIKDEQVWEFLALVHEAKRLGVEVTEDEVTEGIRQWVTALSRAREEDLDNAYTMLLNQLRLTDAGVRYAMRMDLYTGKLLSMISGAVVPTDAVAWQEYAREGLEVRVKTLQAPTVNLIPEVVKPTDAQLAEYFEQSRDAYLIPPKATIQYASALKADYPKLFPVTDAEVEAWYEEHKVDEYLLPPETDDRRADIDLESTDTLDLESTDAAAASTEVSLESTDSAAVEARYRPLSEVAEEIRQRLIDQKALDVITDAKIDLDYHKDWTLESVAQQYGLPYQDAGPLSAGELAGAEGFGGASVLDGTSVVNTVFPTPPVQVTIATGPDGIYLFKVADMVEQRQPELDEVRYSVESDYIRSEAEKLAMEEAENVLAELKTDGWQKFLGNPRYTIVETGLMRQLECEELTEEARATQTGKFGGPVLGPEGAYVVEVLERKEPDVEEFDRYKNFVKSIYAMRHREAFIGEWKDDLIRRANVQKAAPRPESAAEEAPDLLY